MEVGSSAFLQVLERCCRRTSYWHLVVAPDNKGRERNEVDDFKVDTEQEIETVNNCDDIPDFLKEG